MALKIDSNLTGLSYCEETDLKVLPASPVFYALEPNSYADFGGSLTTIARNPINPSRQRKKGVITDLDASGGFNQDLTINNTTRLLQGVFFADARQKASTSPLNGNVFNAVAVAGGVGSSYEFATGIANIFKTNDLVLASGFGQSANNGLKLVTTDSTATLVTVETGSTAEETTPPAEAKLDKVGFQFGADEVSLEMNGQRPRLTSTIDLTSLGLIPGEWVFLGGDDAATTFDNNAGFARISSITSTYIEFDKTSWGAIAEAGTGKTIQVFFGDIVIKNESDPDLIKRRTYHVERRLGKDANGDMAEYLIGAVANEFSINVAQADKVNIDISFVATDNEQRTGLQGLKPGTRISLPPEDAFNTSSDFSRIKLSLATEDAAQQPLFAFATELTLSINNNVSPNKAVGVLGAFDTSAGTFEVGGSLTAYFASVEAVQAVRNNDDVSLDIIMVKHNKALLFDVPLLSLGDGRLNVEQDQAITLPLETNAAESKFGHTLLYQVFSYVPTLVQ